MKDVCKIKKVIFTKSLQCAKHMYLNVLTYLNLINPYKVAIIV